MPHWCVCLLQTCSCMLPCQFHQFDKLLATTDGKTYLPWVSWVFNLSVHVSTDRHTIVAGQEDPDWDVLACECQSARVQDNAYFNEIHYC